MAAPMDDKLLVDTAFQMPDKEHKCPMTQTKTPVTGHCWSAMAGLKESAHLSGNHNGPCAVWYQHQLLTQPHGSFEDQAHLAQLT